MVLNGLGKSGETAEYDIITSLPIFGEIPNMGCDVAGFLLAYSPPATDTNDPLSLNSCFRILNHNPNLGCQPSVNFTDSP